MSPQASFSSLAERDLNLKAMLKAYIHWVCFKELFKGVVLDVFPVPRIVLT